MFDPVSFPKLSQIAAAPPLVVPSVNLSFSHDHTPPEPKT